MRTILLPVRAVHIVLVLEQLLLLQGRQRPGVNLLLVLRHGLLLCLVMLGPVLKLVLPVLVLRVVLYPALLVFRHPLVHQASITTLLSANVAPNVIPAHIQQGFNGLALHITHHLAITDAPIHSPVM